MGRIIKINKDHATYTILKDLYNSEKNPRVKIRLLVILLAYEDKKSEEIAKTVKLTGVTVRRILRRYNKRGLYGIKDIPRPDKECILTDEEMNEINTVLKASPRDVDIPRSNWTGEVLRKFIRIHFNKEIALGTAYNVLHRLDYTKTRAKKRNMKADPIKVEIFREETEKLFKNKDDSTVILYEDEGIFSSEPTATSVWTKTGEQAIVKTKGESRTRKVIYGAVNPITGDLYEQITEAGNTEGFKSFLIQVSEANKGKNVIMLLDNAIYHHFKGREAWFKENASNIEMIYFPSYCSELNPVDHLWKDIRTAVTHNTLFENLSIMINYIKDYIKELRETPKKLSKLCAAIC